MGEQGFKIEIDQGFGGHDYNPREWDNLGTLVMMKDGDFQGDKHARWDEIHRLLNSKDRNLVMLPVYRYEHGGVALSTRSFVGRAHHAEWDSGLTGVIYTTRQRIRELYAVPKCTEEYRLQAVNEMRQEVETYGQWLNGEVYIVTLFDANGEIVDVCGGITGYEEAERIGKEMAGYHKIEGLTA